MYCAPLEEIAVGGICTCPTEKSTAATPARSSMTTTVTTTEPLTKMPSAGLRKVMTGPASTKTLVVADAAVPPAVVAVTTSR